MKNLAILLLLSIAKGIDILKIDMSLEYFDFKNIKQVCAISCVEDSVLDIITLTRQAAIKGMFVSTITISSTTKDQENKQKLKEMCWKQHLQPIGILIQSSCKYFEEIMILASEEMMLSSYHQWLIIQDESRNETEAIIYGNSSALIFDNMDIDQADINASELINSETVNVFNKLNISVDVDIVIAVQLEPTIHQLFDIFNYGKIQGGKLNIENFATWNKGLQVVLLQNKYKRRWDFQGLSLRMVFVKSNPSSYFDPMRLKSNNFDPEINVMAKLSASVLIELAEEHNIKFVFKAVDRWIGSFEPNSSEAVSTSLAYREHDISPIIRAAADLYGTGRLEYAQPPLVWYIGSKFYYRIPNSGTGNIENNFLSPLSKTVWICVAMSLLSCVIVLLLSARLEQRPGFAQYAVFSVWANVCQQYFDDAGENISQRVSSARKVTMLITGISCLLIYNYYTSSVVSNLLNGPPPSINSLEELANSPLQLILEDIGISRSWLYTPGYTFDSRYADGEDNLRKKKIFNKNAGDPLFVTLDEGISMVKSGGYALAAFEEGANAKFAMVLNPTEMCEIGSFWAISPAVVYPALPFRGGYREFFVWGLTSFKERGIMNSIYQRVRSAKIKCVGTVPRALALGGAAPAFIMLSLGFVVAVAVMIVEMFKHRFSCRPYLK